MICVFFGGPGGTETTEDQTIWKDSQPCLQHCHIYIDTDPKAKTSLIFMMIYVFFFGGGGGGPGGTETTEDETIWKDSQPL